MAYCRLYFAEGKSRPIFKSTTAPTTAAAAVAAATAAAAATVAASAVGAAADSAAELLRVRCLSLSDARAAFVGGFLQVHQGAPSPRRPPTAAWHWFALSPFLIWRTTGVRRAMSPRRRGDGRVGKGEMMEGLGLE